MSKVLVVEDISDSANLARKILLANGYDVLIAATGEEALHYASQGGLNMIIMDLGLPDVDGQTLLGILRRDYKLDSIPIIVCTAWPEESAKKMTKAYGFDDYISKPYRVLEFMSVVNRALKHLDAPNDSLQSLSR